MFKIHMYSHLSDSLFIDVLTFVTIDSCKFPVAKWKPSGD